MPTKPKRLLPTKTGWWWYRWEGLDDPEIAQIVWGGTKLAALVAGSDYPFRLDHAEVTWIAPVNPEPLKPEEGQ